MDEPKELYHEEIKKLRDFRTRLNTHAIYKQDLESFSDDYEELVAQTKVITRVSDRLQKKLDTANTQIREKNVEISDKNDQLEETITELAKARIGRKASTIMLVVALFLFFLEQYFLEPVIDEMIPMKYDFVSILILIGLFFLVKFLEGALERYFMRQEQKRIISREEKS